MFSDAKIFCGFINISLGFFVHQLSNELKSLNCERRQDEVRFIQASILLIVCRIFQYFLVHCLTKYDNSVAAIRNCVWLAIYFTYFKEFVATHLLPHRSIILSIHFHFYFLVLVFWNSDWLANFMVVTMQKE